MTLPLPPLVTCGVPMFGSHWLRVCVRRASSETVRLVVTAMKWVGRCKSGNKPDRWPVGNRINKHSPPFLFFYLGWSNTPPKCIFLWCLQGCTIIMQTFKRISWLYITFERHLVILIFEKDSHVNCQKIFRQGPYFTDPQQLHNSCRYLLQKTKRFTRDNHHTRTELSGKHYKKRENSYQIYPQTKKLKDNKHRPSNCYNVAPMTKKNFSHYWTLWIWVLT